MAMKTPLKLGGRVAHFGNEFKKIRTIAAPEAAKSESPFLMALSQGTKPPRLAAASGCDVTRGLTRSVPA
jgi:hypothetical protein